MPTDYALYLRKSRADLEAEAHGEGDTLARHEHILMELAKSRALPIGAIYREIVSGERIANRPVMQRLLSEVEDGRWKGVLVTESARRYDRSRHCRPGVQTLGHTDRHPVQDLRPHAGGGRGMDGVRPVHVAAGVPHDPPTYDRRHERSQA